MILKDDFFLKWFSTLNFCESMFGAKEIICDIWKDGDSSINIKVNKDSKICIDVFGFFDDKKIMPYNIKKYICFKLEKIKNNKFKEKVELSDNLVENKIYEKLNKGIYQLSLLFKDEYKKDITVLSYKIKFYDEDIQIEQKNVILYCGQYFPKTEKLYSNLDIITHKLIPPNLKSPMVLPENPKYNKINFDYINNNTLYWIEPSYIFDKNNYKYEALNYENVSIIKVYNLIYFVPVFIIFYFIQKNLFKILLPENQVMTIDENYNILSFSEGLNGYCKIGATLFEYNLKVKQSYSKYKNNNNINDIISNRMNIRDDFNDKFFSNDNKNIFPKNNICNKDYNNSYYSNGNNKTDLNSICNNNMYHNNLYGNMYPNNTHNNFGPSNINYNNIYPNNYNNTYPNNYNNAYPNYYNNVYPNNYNNIYPYNYNNAYPNYYNNTYLNNYTNTYSNK